ncbi:MAG: hypothetical protein GY757_06380, partial [bacterium]|nr:hypothetical protein [bacterium]
PGAVRLELSEDKKVYGKNDTFTPLTAGRYLSGKTMAGDKPDYVFRFGRGHTLYSRGLRKEYAFGLDETFKVDWDKYKPVEGEGTFDAEGHFRPVIHLGKYKQIPHIIGMYYEINAETRQGNVLNHEIYMHYFPGDSAVGLCIPDGNEAGKPIEVDVAVINSTCKPADTRASMWIYKEREFVTETQNKWEKIKEYKDLKLKGQDTVKLESLLPGTYLLKCDAKDKDGDIISTSRTFYVGDYNSPYEHALTLKAHKLRAYGQKFVTLSIKSHEKGRALVTVENNKILDYYFVPLDTPFATKKIPIPLKEAYFPTIEINAIAIYENGDHEESNEIWLKLPPAAKKLKVEIRPKAKETTPTNTTAQPANPAKLAITVTDSQGKGKKARLFVYAVNETTLRLREYWPFPVDLVESFYYHTYQHYSAN